MDRKAISTEWIEKRMKSLMEGGLPPLKASQMAIRQWAVAPENPDAKKNKGTEELHTEEVIGHDLQVLEAGVTKVPRIEEVEDSPDSDRFYDDGASVTLSSEDQSQPNEENGENEKEEVECND